MTGIAWVAPPIFLQLLTFIILLLVACCNFQLQRLTFYSSCGKGFKPAVCCKYSSEHDMETSWSCVQLCLPHRPCRHWWKSVSFPLQSTSLNQTGWSSDPRYLLPMNWPVYLTQHSQRDNGSSQVKSSTSSLLIQCDIRTPLQESRQIPKTLGLLYIIITNSPCMHEYKRHIKWYA